MDAMRKLKPAELRDKVKNILARSPDDNTLRGELEELARHPSFGSLTWLWGPALYGRSRVFFRPFILSHFTTFEFIPPFRFKAIEWKGEAGKALGDWLAEVEKYDDVELFRRLYEWKITKGWRVDQATVLRDLMDAYTKASTAARRAVVLEKYNLSFWLDEATAMRLFEIDAKASRTFILRHLPMGFWNAEKRILWTGFRDLAEKKGDRELSFTLYRKQVPLKQWRIDVMGLCDSLQDPGELLEALKIRHPEGYGFDVSDTFHDLARKRGRDVLPYIIENLRQVWFRGLRGLFTASGNEKMAALALEKGWLDLWAAIVRITLSHPVYNREVLKLIDDEALADSDRKGRLALLAGISREFNFPGLGLAMVKPLEDKTAVRLYERYPALLKGPFKAQVGAGWGQVYPKLLEKAMAAADEELIDYLASRMVTRGRYYVNRENEQVFDRISRYYEERRDGGAAFSRRASEVLGQVPAFSIYDYKSIIRENRLARLLFERSLSSYLDDGKAMTNLIEAPEIHVQALAYRILALNDDRARAMAASHVELLLGTLLRPLHRRTRIPAFNALYNAASTPELAARIVRRAREAFDLPDLHYPKEKLAGLLGRLLAQWPHLQAEAERPVIYGEVS